MKILRALKERNYLVLAIVSAIVMLFLLPVLQSLATGGIQNIDLWFTVIPTINLVFVFIFSIVFGIFLSFQIFNLRSKVCSIGTKTVSATGGGFAAIIGILVPACPACISIVTLFLPAAFGISVAGFFLQYNLLLLSGSILLLVLGIYLLGGFKKY